ncbi:alpha/beta fold hydrolase [Austwickia sp. TVS 96-490-7B]|uniref:alpha/beta fold hydrolase n=1 Tax=Austwickia sp. TVS 96-490-7B TaxID=2830843 RepID=UPI00210484B7|nr:alpha/beta hydrolase [Austwickia sp. TVS 96-490-7B]
MTPRPLLVLVPGTRFDTRQWRDYDTLLPDAQLHPIDLPGHGSRAGQPWTWTAALDIIGAAIDTATPDQAVVLAGHSLGGYLAAAYAHDHAHQLDALALIGATADPSRHPRLTGLYTGFARLLPLIGADRMAGVANHTMRRLGATDDDIPDATGYAVTPQAWADIVTHARAAHLSPLRCPVHLIAGQHDQMRLDLATYLQHCHDGRVTVIPGASHLAPVTHRDQVAAVLRRALYDAERFAAASSAVTTAQTARTPLTGSV